MGTSEIAIGAGERQAPADAAAVRDAGETEDRGDWQDVRIAVVMNGGVSLAIWISGVALELCHLVQASRAVPGAPAAYAQLLEELRATARIDVIAGTSAGGLNGGFLALGLVHDCDLAAMGDLWADAGALERLLRSPLEKSPPSLLSGDGYFLSTVRRAYRDVLASRRMTRPPDDSVNGVAPSPVELIMTTTLLDGRRSLFTDDQGTPIVERDFGGLFRFSNTGTKGPGDLSDVQRIGEQLAVASRCTSCFPGAFEPHWVDVGDRADGGWASSGGVASFQTTQYVVDGGVLLNKPIRPALEAIYRQPAERQVRRVLAYVVPDPGAAAARAAAEDNAAIQAAQSAPTATRVPVPAAGQVLLATQTRLLSTDSVSRELDEIRRRNEAAQSRRTARARITAAMAAGATDLAELCWKGYLEERRRNAGRVIAGFITESTSLWSRTELASAIANRPAGAQPFIPTAERFADAAGRTGEEWDWGLTTVERLGAICIDVLKRALWLAPLERLETRAALIAARKETHESLIRVQALHADLDRFWRGLPLEGSPHRMPAPPAEPGERAEALATWLDKVLPVWEGTSLSEERAERYKTAMEFAELLANRPVVEALLDATQNANSALDPSGEERDTLEQLLSHLLREPSSLDGPQMLRRMLELEVVQLAFTGASDEVEQQVELVQISADAPAPGGRARAPADKLTGVQLHHFGAFYRKSWRVNDWMWGRLDAATRLAETLLDPDRVAQLGWTRSTALDTIRKLATAGQAQADVQWLAEQVTADAARCRRELEFLPEETQGAAAVPGQPAGAGASAGRPRQQLPKTLPDCARQLARIRHLQILREELPHLAEAIRTDTDSDSPLATSGRAWLQQYEHEVKAAGGPDPQVPDGGRMLPAAVAFRLLDQSPIGRQRIAEDVGSDGLTELSSAAAAVFASVFSTTPRIGPARWAIKALRGYALVLWAMVMFTRNRGKIGAALVQTAIVSGAALIGLSLVVPGIPPAVTVVGAAVVLAAVSLACLRAIARPAHEGRQAEAERARAAREDGRAEEPAQAPPGKPPAELAELQRRAERRAVRRIGGTLAIVAVLLVGAVVALAFWRGNQLQLQTGLLVKTAVVIALVLLGVSVGAAATAGTSNRQESGR
jgi:patatin-related protein